MVGETIAGLVQRARPDPVQPPRVQRSPVDGDRHGRAGRGQGLGGRLRAKVPGPAVRTPRPDGQQRQVDAERAACRDPRTARCRRRNRSVGPASTTYPTGCARGAPGEIQCAAGTASTVTPPIESRSPATTSITSPRSACRARAPSPRGTTTVGEPRIDRSDSRVEVVRMSMRDQHEVDVQIGHIVRHRSVPLQRAQAARAGTGRSGSGSPRRRGAPWHARRSRPRRRRHQSRVRLTRAVRPSVGARRAGRPSRRARAAAATDGEAG